MSIPILILGNSGTGKTRSTKSFEEHELLVVNTTGKMLSYFDKHPDMLNVPAKAREVQQKSGGAMPFKADIIRSYLNKYHDHKAVVIDDYGYALFEIYDRYRLSEEERLSNRFEPFDIIVRKMSQQVDALMYDGDADRIVYIVMHADKDNDGMIKPLVMGKFVNEKYVLEGLMTVTLYSEKLGDRYVFHTNNGNPAKSPDGLFAEDVMDNDLRAIDARIREAYGYEPLKEVKING